MTTQSRVFPLSSHQRHNKHYLSHDHISFLIVHQFLCRGKVHTHVFWGYRKSKSWSAQNSWNRFAANMISKLPERPESGHQRTRGLKDGRQVVDAIIMSKFVQYDKNHCLVDDYRISQHQPKKQVRVNKWLGNCIQQVKRLHLFIKEQSQLGQKLKLKLQEQSMNKMAKASNTKGMSTLQKKKVSPIKQLEVFWTFCIQSCGTH